MKWEYRCELAKGKVSEFDALGESGWELAALERLPGETIAAYWFKRPKIETYTLPKPAEEQKK